MIPANIRIERADLDKVSAANTPTQSKNGQAKRMGKPIEPSKGNSDRNSNGKGNSGCKESNVKKLPQAKSNDINAEHHSTRQPTRRGRTSVL